tara:strand:+ start:1212 stop:1466 length:255 start_codon:yes stop_codon:yes gene_type:complete
MMKTYINSKKMIPLLKKVNGMGEIEELKAKFLRAYINLPEPERVQAVAIVEDKPYSWDAANREISNNTPLGTKILKKMKLLGIL